jgi:alpha-L-arabinofuranosidase
MGWVEYCNSTKDSYYANLRRQNGHEEPYNVGAPAMLQDIKPHADHG